MTSPHVHGDSDLPHRYVAGRLSPSEAETFEQHLLDCAACRAAVRLGAATRVALREPLATTNRSIGRSRVAAGVLAAAAVVAFISVIARSGRVDPLARVVPPTFESSAVRSASDSAATFADRGMAAYASGDYAAAARWLERAARVDSSPAVTFYLGTSLLATGDAATALSHLIRARRPAANPYAIDATIFGAKALLRLGRRDSALALLATPLDAQREVEPRLSAFADSIRRQ